jgi:hypothetical protein
MEDYERAQKDPCAFVGYFNLNSQAQESIRALGAEVERLQRKLSLYATYQMDPDKLNLAEEVARLQAQNDKYDERWRADQAKVERYRAALRRLFKATSRSIHNDEVWLPALDQARATLAEENGFYNRVFGHNGMPSHSHTNTGSCLAEEKD